MVFMHGICLFAFLIKEFVCFSNRNCFFAMGFGLLFLQFFKGFCFFRKRLCLFSAVSLFLCKGFFACFFATLCISDRVLVWFW